MTKLMTFVVFEKFGFLDIVGPGDVFTIANQRAGKHLYQVQVTSLGSHKFMQSESGMRVGIDIDLASLTDTHTLLITGGDGFRDAIKDSILIGHIRRLSKHSKRVASICTGAFLLAETGVLNQRLATTHWAHADELQHQYPDVNVVSDDLFIRDGKYTTAAGMASGIDLALDMVARDHGQELARKTSQRMVLYLNRAGGQSQFSERQIISSEPSDRFEKLLRQIAKNPTDNLNNQVLAQRLSVSERHLARVFRDRTGTTPARWLERIRVDTAREYLESSLDSIDSIAWNSGFNSAETFRQAFYRVMEMTPAQYRKMHASKSR